MTRTIRNTLLASGAALLLSTGIAAASPATAQADVNVRSGPGTEYPVVGTLRAGETVDVAGYTGSWCRVRTPSGAGFASQSYLAMAGGVPGVGVAVTPGYVEGGYAYNDYPGYGYDDYYDNGYDYGPNVGVFVGGRFRHRDFDRDHHWNGGRTGAWNGTGTSQGSTSQRSNWQGNRTGTWQGGRTGAWQGNRTGTWQGRTSFNSGNRVGGATPGSVTPMQHNAPNMSAPTGLHSGPAPSAGAAASAGAHVGGAGRDRH